jgi:hypothetical protein
VIHGVALFAQHERKDGLSSIHNYNKRNVLSSDTSGFFRCIQLTETLADVWGASTNVNFRLHVR